MVGKNAHTAVTCGSLSLWNGDSFNQYALGDAFYHGNRAPDSDRRCADPHDPGRRCAQTTLLSAMAHDFPGTVIADYYRATGGSPARPIAALADVVKARAPSSGRRRSRERDGVLAIHLRLGDTLVMADFDVRTELPALCERLKGADAWAKATRHIFADVDCATVPQNPALARKVRYHGNLNQGTAMEGALGAPSTTMVAAAVCAHRRRGWRGRRVSLVTGVHGRWNPLLVPRNASQREVDDMLARQVRLSCGYLERMRENLRARAGVEATVVSGSPDDDFVALASAPELLVTSSRSGFSKAAAAVARHLGGHVSEVHGAHAGNATCA